ncbi:unnamed protein product [Nyctereutes procyonoides]|uniref:(raccoon dog) hypothetical protein n=1 Tax=Nyctereutes procyonoides TaxID=34880 RepID=A0A811XUG2_NYCPR|nr:unnamed protein product [Nyctereutes procyonoides]
MKLLRILLLLIIQGHSFICQKKEVRGPEGGTLTTYCKYTSGWESYKKWWCRGKHWNSCRILVKTTGSEKLVKKGRASIQDDHGIRTINMTLEELRRDDADTYWCGIEKTGKDLGYKFSVIVDPGTLMGTLITKCSYGQGWESYKKWWCHDCDWDSCKTLVKTTGSEKLVKKGQVSIQDNHSQCTLP